MWHRFTVLSRAWEGRAKRIPQARNTTGGSYRLTTRVACLLLLAAATPGLMSRSAQATVTSKPNIVIIMTDDQRWDTVTPSYMPNVTKLLLPNGVSFSNSFVSNPLCCPSRVSTLTGNYSYTTGVYGNSGAWGGYGASVQYGAVNDTIATDLQADGYTTGLIGKYLNGYDASRDYLTKPPGWSHWFAVNTGAYYNYPVAVDGTTRLHYGTAANDYITRVLQGDALSFISGNAGNPFFLYFAPTAPHGPAIADPRDLGRFDANVAAYVDPPSDPESNVSDKPAYIQNRGWSSTAQSNYDAFHAKQLASLYSVDRAIGAIWRALPTNTIVLFMSDNGYAWGEHRWGGKMVPYNESLRVPMVIAAKGVDLSAIGPLGGTSSRVALNVDVRPSLESFVTDLPQQPTTDGLAWTGGLAWTTFPIMHWNFASVVPTYCGLRSADWMYVKYADGFEEAYNEQLDPYEENNLFVTNPTNPQLPVLRAQAAWYCSPRLGRIYPDDWPFPPT